MAKSFDFVNDVIIWGFKIAQDAFKKQRNVSIRYGLTGIERDVFIEETWKYFLHHENVIADAVEANVMNAKVKYPDSSDEAIVFFAKYRVFITAIIIAAIEIVISRKYSTLTFQELLDGITALSIPGVSQKELDNLKARIKAEADQKFNDYYEEKRYTNYMP